MLGANVNDEDERRARLARAWDEAAPGYEQYFVPRFAPWVATAVDALNSRPEVPAGPILVPCCGTFPELPALLQDHSGREIVGIDLSEGMVRLARQRAAGRPNVQVVEGDATELCSRWPGRSAGVVSVFGLQQLPDPGRALSDWVGTLRPGGRLSVVFWPSPTESVGPFALLDRVLAGRRPAADDSWQGRLADHLTSGGATVERDESLTFEMSHPDAATFWAAMTDGGPLRALVIARGEAFMSDLRQRFMELAPSGPWRHSPRARWIVATR